ncbi:NADH dehydrogenase [ubiquinone] iron-sulfur protein 6, mitochondrial-like [Varroa jacobsoni]|uniref:Zinc finger CHCC-type domain-containing protein n=1 Tax=Varroa destructor TaxID=109461 RepID=A0A7M7KVM7_VARDE|nr:NADH dehydrogenase [ubiquinone] iron-sulfur protein 6, mitochondrial-like [Varroa destructor]XP_022708813.1 NADH dehydrogenase [ubiquinone] iron-sulfur protein 6, mitochondrial-like [Varroa jacobsoni]
MGTEMAHRALKLLSGFQAYTGAAQTRCLAFLKQTNPPDIQTHTGQKYDENDFRNCRFVDKSKLVNKHHAIKLIAEVPAVGIEARSVYCSGGDAALGHPKVYINLDPPGEHTCLYCGLRYFQKSPKHHH